MTTELDSATDIIRASLGPNVEVRAQAFPSGAMSFDIRRGSRFAVIDTRPSINEWAVSIEPTEHEGFAGHDHVTASLASAVELVRERWSSA